MNLNLLWWLAQARKVIFIINLYWMKGEMFLVFDVWWRYIIYSFVAVLLNKVHRWQPKFFVISNVCQLINKWKVLKHRLKKYDWIRFAVIGKVSIGLDFLIIIINYTNAAIATIRYLILFSVQIPRIQFFISVVGDTRLSRNFNIYFSMLKNR